MREFIDWHCSEPRLAFNKAVVTLYASASKKVICIVHYQPQPGGCPPSDAQGCRLWGSQSRPDGRNPAGEGSEKAWYADRQLLSSGIREGATTCCEEVILRRRSARERCWSPCLKYAFLAWMSTRTPSPLPNRTERSVRLDRLRKSIRSDVREVCDVDG